MATRLGTDIPPLIETIEEARELLFADLQRVLVMGNSMRCWISQGVWDSQDQGFVATRVAIAELSEDIFFELSEDPRLTQCLCSQFFQKASDPNIDNPAQ